MKADFLDLRDITRDSDRVFTRIEIACGPGNYNNHDWIWAGESSIDCIRDGVWSLKAYMPRGIVDEENDSAYAFQIYLVGLSFSHMWYGVSTFNAWISSESVDDLRVPPRGFDLEANIRTDRNGNRYTDFLPPVNTQLFEHLRGKRVVITTGPVHDLDN